MSVLGLKDWRYRHLAGRMADFALHLRDFLASVIHSVVGASNADDNLLEMECTDM